MSKDLDELLQEAPTLTFEPFPQEKPQVPVASEPIVEEKEEEKSLSEVERILLETDLNTMSPMQAFMLLGDLKDKLDGDK